MVARINSAFTAAFEEIGCAGDVALDTGSGDDYDKYSIQVRGSAGLLAYGTMQ